MTQHAFQTFVFFLAIAALFGAYLFLRRRFPQDKTAWHADGFRMRRWRNNMWQYRDMTDEESLDGAVDKGW